MKYAECIEWPRVAILLLVGIFGIVGASAGEGFLVHASYDPSVSVSESGSVMVAFHLETDEIITSYHWDFGDGSSSLNAAPFHAYTSDGPFHVRLTVTTQSGLEVLMEEPDLVVIHNQVIAEDFDTLVDEDVWDAEEAGANENREPYGWGYAMGFPILRDNNSNQQMPNEGIIVGNDTGASGDGNTCEPDCEEAGAFQGFFRFDTEIIPGEMVDPTEFVIFRLDPVGAAIRGRVADGALSLQIELGAQKSPWQILSAIPDGPLNGSRGKPSEPPEVPKVKGKFEVRFHASEPGLPGQDFFTVEWTPSSGGSTALSWGVTHYDVGGWKDLQIGAFDTPVHTGLDSVGLVWFDNFELLRYSFGGPSL